MNFSKISLEKLACFVYETLKSHGIELVVEPLASEKCYE
jgi:hypothetical protein